MSAIDDPYTPKATRHEDTILFATASRPAPGRAMEDFLTHFSNEYFVLADGVGSLPHAQEAAKLTAETARWAYEVVRQRPFYWGEKQELMKRIFRTTNLTLWQKRRDPGFGDGLASALTALLVLPEHFWVGWVGTGSTYLYRDGLIDVLTVEDVDGEGMITKAAGFARTRLLPQIRSEQFLHDDCILVASDGVSNSVSEEDMRAIFEMTGVTQDGMQKAVDTLIESAVRAGSRDDASAIIVKRIPTKVI